MTRALTVAILLACASLAGCATAVMGNSGSADTRTSAQLAADTATSADVKARLLADASLKNFTISVLTYMSQVTLSGFVDTAEQRDKAGQLARSVKGVKSVDNKLSVR
jgi:osmotically-inducible protein OsmY